ncbi:TadE/TadG family type IV pilus assembly protein [Rhodospirillaceae bacterium SYSU D60014]|uniref:TadE/TadG family type IV pilus assembly protein n=1 Tax=Virgifigura deserti TaxID=2268457 RepID=UPI000E661383
MEAFDRIRRDLRSCWTCSRGISVLQFALAAPILFLLVFGVIEVALIMFISSAAESALKEAFRFGITGQQVNGEVGRQQRILDILGDYTFGMIDRSQVVITRNSYSSFSDVGQPEPFTDIEPLNGVYDPGEPFDDLNGSGRWEEDRGIEGIGNVGDAVLYRIDYEWELFTPVVSLVLGSNGRLPMSASIVLRNECWVLTGNC